MNSQPPDQNSEELARAGGGGESSLGAQLRAARERRNISLRELSDQTRIARRYLEAIEQDNHKELPGGIFNRSFIKAYAKAVGFSEEEAVKAYTKVAREHGEEPDELPTSRQHSRIYMDGDTGRSPIITALLSFVILAIISLGIYAGLHYYQRRSADDTAAQPAQPTTPAAATADPAANNQTSPAPNPAASTPAADGLNVQIRANGEDVWMRTRVDEESSSDGILAADQIKDLKPAERLLVEFSKSKAAALEVTINGRPASVPTETRKGRSLVEMVITKDGYEQLLQRP